MAKYLDENGLLYFWQKIKSTFAQKGEIPSIDTATPSANGLMSSTDKAKLDAFGNASSYALKSDISSMYKYKGSVATASALPSSDQEVGDVYNIIAASIYGGAGMNVVWTGSDWDALGEVLSITSITNSEIDTVVST